MILKNSLFLLLAASLIASSVYNGSTTASVILAGGIVKAKSSINNSKYKRSECPVCKGNGWYISGDGIKKVDCGYCVPDETLFVPELKSILKKPATIIRH